MDDAAIALDQTFHALSDPNRRAILSIVRKERCAVGEIADALGLAYKAVANACTGVKAKLGVARTADLERDAFSPNRRDSRIG